MIRFLAALALALSAASAFADQPSYSGIDEILAAGAANCAGFDEGVFSQQEGAISEIDLDGDGRADKVVEEAKFSCSSAASLYCGTGGCMIHIIVGDQVYSRLAKGWKPVEWAGDAIILLELHGTECGGTNLRRCYEAITWSEGGFRSVRAPVEGMAQ